MSDTEKTSAHVDSQSERGQQATGGQAPASTDEERDTPWLVTECSGLHDRMVVTRMGAVVAEICDCDGRFASNAEFIVRRVNSHDALVAALTRLSNETAGLLGFAGDELRAVIGNTNFAVIETRVAEAKVALAKVNG